MPGSSLLTGDQADANSAARAHKNLQTMRVMGVIMFLICLALAGLLQSQQQRLETAIDKGRLTVINMCLQRQANTQRTNANWEALSAIEKRNKFIDDDIRQARIKVYESAKLVVPDCR